MNNLTLLKTKDLPIDTIKGMLTFEVSGKDVCIAKVTSGRVDIPRHTFSLDQLKKMGVRVLSKFDPIKLEPMNSTFDLKPEFSIRENQKEACDAMTDHYLSPSGWVHPVGGVLNLACGKGKTFLGLYLASLMKRKTVIVSPQKAHLENWILELKKFFDFDGTIGWIQGKKREWDADIICATVQTLSNMVDKGEAIPDGVGLAIYDECHGMSAMHFSKAADVFGGHRLGLSATPNRTDKNEGIFLSHLGKVFYSDITQDLLPSVKVINTGIFVRESDRKSFVDAGGNVNLNLIRSWLSSNKERNTLIVEEIQKCLDEGRTVYVLSHNVDHIKTLSESFPGSSVIHGGTKSEDRLPLLNTGNIVFATIQIGKEAYNRKELDTLFLVTPFAARKHAAIAFEQSVGRIQRQCEGKKDPVVYLFKDSDIQMCTALISTLIRHSKKKGYEIKYE